ncbi:ABC transporter substrate-binding protein [Aneurinibacillus thermoaerophilus]|uniref:ABC transporter substrate-binding protein n=1 Tax=Aneurinibacillus thermoaerophilus TaxID=143495 RepID=UPI002E1EE556|nr:ABC transporter substrate-binding protein [Aneurinibacillus thermoaerophilus]MED0738318.1 ABC transporter substrate-binding protein [Aneurinibacillus thermoaerophilus]MED0765371.1 ABC transporter substrate-binding protein [Aneurinibacillus thermoaerophilus]
MKKRWASIFLMLLLSMSLILAGCSGQTASKTDGSAEGEQAAGSGEGKPVEIDFWYALGGKNGKVIEEMVKEFNATHKNIVVKPAYQGDYYQNHAKVLSAVAAGNQPDVTMVEIASVGAFADAKVLEDLTPYAQGVEKKYIPGLMGNSYWKDKLYAIPFNRSTPLLYVNRDMLKAANLDPSGPKTWDELVKYARALTKKEGDKTKTYGFSTPIDIWFYEALVFQNGGNILSEDGKQLTINNEAGKAPLKLWSDMVKEGIMKNPPGEKYNAWDVAKQDFLNKQVGMIFTSTGDLQTLKSSASFDVGAAFLPAAKSYGVPTGGANLVMLAKSSDEEKKAAWEFIKWMSDTPQTIKWSLASGYMPVTTEAVQSPEMQEAYKKDPNLKVAVDQLEYAKPRPMVPGYKELQEIIMSELQRAMLGQATVDEALETAVKKAQKTLKK